MNPTTPPAAGAELQRFLKQVAMSLAMASKVDFAIHSLAAAGGMSTNDASSSACLVVTTKMRLPSIIAPPQVTAAGVQGELLAGSSILATMSSADTACGREMPNLDKPTVTRGSLVLAALASGVDVSSEMETEIAWPMPDGQRLVWGKATQDMIPDGYVPFATALGYVCLGDKVQTSAVAPGRVITANSGRR